MTATKVYLTLLVHTQNSHFHIVQRRIYYMEEKRTCTGICKNYQVKKPPGKQGRYESGQGRCQTCDIWISYRGAHKKDGEPAEDGSMGWFCNCCNMRVRQKPRNKVYKEKLQEKIKQRKANVQTGIKS